MNEIRKQKCFTYHKKFVYFSIVPVCLIASWLLQICSAFCKSPAQTIDSTMLELRKPHPILGHFDSLDSLVLGPAEFAKLNNAYVKARGAVSPLVFQDTEKDIGLRFCKLAQNLDPYQIELLAGRPSSKLQLTLYWADSKAGEENWIYYFGVTGVPVRLVFKEGKCVDASILQHSYDVSFQKWRSEHLRQTCLGRTDKEIVASQGEPCSRISSQLFRGGSYQTGERLTYSVGPETSVEIILVGGVCVDTKRLVSFR